MGFILTIIGIAFFFAIGVPLFVAFYSVILSFFIGIVRWFWNHMWGFIGLIIIVAILTCIF